MSKKKYCVHNHNILTVGRDKWNRCRGCTVPVSSGLRKRQARTRKQFCIHGHDTFNCGRDIRGYCNDCKMKERLNRAQNVIKRQFCINGHDISTVGRTKHGDCRECVRIRHREYTKKHKEKIRVSNNRWAKNNPDKIQTYRIKCQTNRSLRIVAWTDWDNILEFERNKPKGMTTDHYIPLQGELVSGLHVSWNLQYLTTPQNSSKRNKINLLTISEWYGKILEDEGLK
jgi:hypothetical protein